MIKKCLCACISCFIFSAFLCSCDKTPTSMPQPNDNTVAEPSTDVSLPVIEGISPLTGKQAKHCGKLPLAVMVDNVRVALPQRGLTDADIIYEMVTEGGITRLMALYEDYEHMPMVGPVRSARDQHVQLMLPIRSLFLHVGSSTYAAELLEQYNYKPISINGYFQSGALELDTQRNKTVPIEHCWFTSGELFSKAADKYKLATDGAAACSVFDFTQEPREPEQGEADNIHIRFSSYVNSDLEYNSDTLKYEKSQFGEPQIDENNGKTLSFDNVIILFTDISKYPDNVLAKVDFRYGGVGYYASRGKYEAVRWMKGDAGSPLRILSPDGEERSVKINTGNTYVAMVDLGKYNYFRLGDEKASQQHDEVASVTGEGETEAIDKQ